jgi:hypothetical protein
MASCAFCGRDEKAVGRMFAGGGDKAVRAGMPAVHICATCAVQCAELIGEEQPAASVVERDARVLVEWTPFVVDDRQLEWAAARVDIEGSGQVGASGASSSDRFAVAGRTCNAIGAMIRTGSPVAQEAA